MGAATVFDSVSALAPGYEAVIVTVGGAICGYCAIGNLNAAASPASTIIMDSTEAKMGRVIKNLVMSFILYLLADFGLQDLIQT